MQRIALTVAALLAGLAFVAPASAQDDGERVNQLIIYGDDPCPPAQADNEITVCARKAEAGRPAPDANGDDNDTPPLGGRGTDND